VKVHENINADLLGEIWVSTEQASYEFDVGHINDGIPQLWQVLASENGRGFKEISCHVTVSGHDQRGGLSSGDFLCLIGHMGVQRRTRMNRLPPSCLYLGPRDERAHSY
jgi:hypothetical protein